LEITPYGFESFRIQGKTIDLLINPIDGAKVGWKVPQISPELILITSEKDYTDVSRAKGEVMAFDRPGEYEIHGAQIRGLAAGPASTAYIIELDDLTVAYLGELADTPSEAIVEAASDSDLLFVPVGGGPVLGAKQAADAVSQISPKVVIPTHYAAKGLKLSGYEPLDPFLKEIGIKGRNETKFKLTRRDLPEELELVILEPGK
jgi:hypothetical protein